MKGTDTVLRAVWAFFFFSPRVDSQLQSECVCCVYKNREIGVLQQPYLSESFRCRL